MFWEDAGSSVVPQQLATEGIEASIHITKSLTAFFWVGNHCNFNSSLNYMCVYNGQSPGFLSNSYISLSVGAEWDEVNGLCII